MGSKPLKSGTLFVLQQWGDRKIIKISTTTTLNKQTKKLLEHQQTSNKLIWPFDPEPYTIAEKNITNYNKKATGKTKIINISDIRILQYKSQVSGGLHCLELA